jgi:lysocardiolipin and lysophospholipid acyltransferase
VNMYWRRFSVSSLPLDDPEKFDLWIRKIWTEKDALMEQYVTTGRFPASRDLEVNGSNSEAKGHQKGFIETEVRQAHWWDFLQIFSVLAVLGLVANILARVWNAIWYGNARA